MNISEQLANLAISRDLLLQRVKNGLAQDVAALYGEMIDDITTKLLKSGKSSNNMTKTINEIKAQLKVPDVMENMDEIARAEINFIKEAYNSVIGADIFKNIPPESVMSKIASTSLIEGATIGAWLKDLEASQAFDVERAIKLGMTLGETNIELAKRLQGTLDISMRHAQTIVITGASSVANKARMDFYEANEDVIEGYQHLSVLDGKTSNVCIARSGLKWDVNKKPIGHKMPFIQPPLHFRCRSTILSILKYSSDFPKGTQSSDIGYLPREYNFNDYLKLQSVEKQNAILGVGRADLWRSGKITLSDLVNQQGRTLSIKELKAR